MTSVRVPSILVLLLAVAMTACKPDPQTGAETNAGTPADPAADTAATHKAATTVLEWHCGELPVSTHFDDESLESITLQTPDRQLTLKSMANEDGARFADAAGNEFWSRPGKVTFTRIGQPMVECTKDRG